MPERFYPMKLINWKCVTFILVHTTGTYDQWCSRNFFRYVQVYPDKENNALFITNACILYHMYTLQK